MYYIEKIEPDCRVDELLKRWDLRRDRNLVVYPVSIQSIVLLSRIKIGKAGMEKETRHKGRVMLKSPHIRIKEWIL